MVNGPNNEIDDETLLYFGSHNFSPSAWGNQEKKDTQLHTANWELGIVFPPGIDTGGLKKQIMESMALDMIDPKKFDLPYDEPFILDK